MIPNPVPAWQRAWRLVSHRKDRWLIMSVSFFLIEIGCSIDEQQFISHEQNLGELLPARQLRMVWPPVAGR